MTFLSHAWARGKGRSSHSSARNRTSTIAISASNGSWVMSGSHTVNHTSLGWQPSGAAVSHTATHWYARAIVHSVWVPASGRPESWTQDHKLWRHINEHLEECRWPRVCPNPLCDASLQDALALQFHFVDDHRFSRTRPVKPANLTALDSQDEKMPLDKEVQGACPSHKRKSSSCTRALEPPQSFHDTPASVPSFNLHFSFPGHSISSNFTCTLISKQR